MQPTAEFIFGIIDPAAITLLPWYIGLPGAAIVLLSLLRSLTALLRLRPIRAFIHVVTAIVVAILLSNFAKVSSAFMPASS